jgi:hypothetical protein
VARPIVPTAIAMLALASPVAAVEPPAPLESAPPAGHPFAYTCGHLGIPCARPAPELSIRVTPGRVPLGRSVPVRVRVRRSGSGLAAPAVVSLAGRRVRTDHRGRAVVVAAFASTGRRLVTARAAGTRSVRTWLKVVR